MRAVFSPFSPAATLDLLSAAGGLVAAGTSPGLTRPPGQLRAQRTCPSCGSILDAPRLDPATGMQGRKCDVCVEWHPPELDGRIRLTA